ncbi:MBG domain-containing protein [Rufibacter roseolus]|uniref:MBG domain-containing protein n=1 Tax=Rufibacter roseolus TaxID=2817375 RepID=UPI001B314F77|nr:MBG domain-containing protein [Rufibacter roseolus]
MNVNLLAMAKANARRYGILLCLLILGTVGAFALGDAYVDAGLPAPSVTSDKDDYAPGEIAHITGSGWTLDSVVHVEFKEEPDYPDYHVYDVVVDANGNWKIDYQVEQRHLGVKFTVTSTGKQSNYATITTFTDANITSISPSSGLPSGGYQVEITARNSFSTGGEPYKVFYGTTQVAIGTIISGDVLSFTAPARISGTEVTITVKDKNNKDAAVTPVTNGPTFKYLKGSASVTLSNLNPIYNGNPISATATTTATGASSFTFTYAPINNNVLGTAVSTPPTNAGSYQVVATLVNNDYTGSDTKIMTIGKAGATISLSNLAHTYNGSAKAAIASTSPAGLSGVTVTYKQGETVVASPTNAGDYTASATLANANYKLVDSKGTDLPAQTSTLVIEKAAATISLSNLAHTYSGSPKAVTATSSPAAAGVTVKYLKNNAEVASSEVVGAGSYNVEAITTNANYKLVDGNGAAIAKQTGTLIIEKAANTISFTNLGTKTFGDAAFDLTASSTSGAAVTFAVVSGPASVSGSKLTITGAGSVKVKASSAETANYLAAADVEQTFTVNKANATLALANLVHVYNGEEKNATVTTTPAGLSGVSVSGSGTNAGDYAAAASLDNPNYQADPVSGTLKIEKASSAVAMSDVTATYDGEAHAAAATATGAGNLSTTSNITYSYVGTGSTTYPASATAPTNAGTYSVTATYTGDTNHTGNSNTATVTINKATATLALNNLTHNYNGSAKLATATSSPVNLSGISISNNGKTDAGSYKIIASLDNPNYTAPDASGTLEIAKADQTISWTAPTAITYGKPISAAQLNATVAGVEGGSAAGALTYSVEAGTIVDAGTHTLTVNAAATNNYNAATKTVSLTVNKAEQVITWSDPANIVYGTPLSGTQLNATALGGATLTYSPEATTVLGAGTRTLTVNAAEAANFKAGSKSVEIIVEKATVSPVWTAGTLEQTYDNKVKTVVATTTPAGLTLSYDFGSATPKNAGSYPVTATIIDDNYSGSLKGTLEIAKANQTITFAEIEDKTYGDAAFAISPSASSNLPVSISTTGNISYNESTGKITINGAGPASVTATQLGDDNYNAASSVTHSFKVNKANQTITVVTSAPEKAVYNSTFTVEATASSGLPVSYGSAGKLSNVGAQFTMNSGTGTGTVSYSQDGDDNYNAATVITETVTAEKANQTITVTTASPASAVYNTSFKVEANATSGLAIEYSSSAPLSNIGDTYTMNSGTGTGIVKYNQAGDDNYHAAPEVTANVTAQKAAATITLTMADLSQTYNGSAKTVGYSISPADVTGVSVTYSQKGAAVSSPTNAGSYEVLASLTNENYSGSAEGTLVIAKASTKTEVVASDAIYNGSAHEGSATVEGDGGLNQSITVYYAGVAPTVYPSSTNAPVNAGTYSATASYAESANYLGSSDEKEFTIGKASSITEVTVPVGPFTYTGKAQTPATVKVTGAGNLELTSTATYVNNINAGTATASYTFAGDDNHTGSEDSKSFIIEKASSETIVTINGGPFTYTGLPITPATVEVTGAGGLSLTPTAEYSNNINAGTATASFSFSGDENHTGSEGSKTFIIGKKAASVVVAPKTKVYGAEDPDFTGTLTGFIEADKVVATYSRVAGETVAAGPYPISATLSPVSALGNYDITNTPATLTISARPIAVKADDKQKTYGDADPELTYAITAGSLVNKDAFAGVLSRAEGEKVGSYTIDKGTLALGDNYDLTFQGAKLTIGKKVASVVVDTKTKVYGNNDPSLTGTLTGFLAADKVVATYSRATGENVGTYAITAALAPQNVLDNYEITNTSATFNITKKAASITPIANSKTYGSSDPTLTGNLAGFLTSDNVTATYSRATGETVAGGPYQISATLAPVSVLGNYDITYNTANFTIGKKAASVVVAAKTKEYGAADPEFTGTLTGFLASDNVQAAYNRVAGETVANGPYAISASLTPATVLSNYEISNTPATLTITKKALVVTAQNTSKYCGQANPTFSVTYDGFVNNEGSSVLGGTLSYSTTANVSSGQAIYDVTPSGLTSSNYAITFKNGVITVNGVTIDASASGNPVPVGTAAKLSATVFPKVSDVQITFKLDGVVKGSALTDANGVATLQVTGLTVNVYQVEASTGSGCGLSTAYLPVYDPTGGFVTGGGWINSPAGAYVKDPAAVGKANFGFVSRYKKGSTALEGETEFQFQAGNLKFNSTSYEAATLVISGAKASYRGVGTINGTGTYKFTLNAIDGQASSAGGSDRVRMKITDAAGATVYDNMIGAQDNADISTVTNTTLGGGSIVIHEVKTTTKSSSAIAVAELPVNQEVKFTSYPNPLTDEASVEFSVAQDEAYSLDIYDMKGSLVKQLQKGKAKNAETITAKWDARSANVGVYIIRLTKGNEVKTLRVVRQ